jgi:hypothetical protein
MAILFMTIDEEDDTVQLHYKGQPLTPKMKRDSPTELLEGLTDAVEAAYRKLREAGVE